MKTMMRLMLVFGVTMIAGATARANNANTACKTYFVVAEKDSNTVDLNMIGLTEAQQSWYNKHGKDFPSLCIVNGDASGKRITLDGASEAYVLSVIGSLPVYLIAWEEHKVFVPDNKGGHYAWSANGILSRWDRDKQDFVAVTPIHNTNHTIFSASDTSLLKAGLKEIEDRTNGK
jgi:hypothetical protein